MLSTPQMGRAPAETEVPPTDALRCPLGPAVEGLPSSGGEGGSKPSPMCAAPPITARNPGGSAGVSWRYSGGALLWGRYTWPLASQPKEGRTSYQNVRNPEGWTPSWHLPRGSLGFRAR